MKRDEWHQSLPRLRLTAAQFFALPEYSASYPTGTTPGKRWRRLDGSHDHAFLRSGGKPRWQIGEYDPTDDGKGKHIKLNWYRPVIIVPALTAPLPDHWQIALYDELTAKLEDQSC